MILDVGSGSSEWRFYSFMPKNHEVLHLDLLKYKGETDIIGDVHNLPFNDNSFNVVQASHILEHVDRPIDALHELFRVAKYLVVVKVPNSDFYRWHSEYHEHIYSWNSRTLSNLLDKIPFASVKISKAYRRGGIGWMRHWFAYFTCLFHGKNELTALCWK